MRVLLVEDDALSQEPYDVVLLDLGLPKKAGLEVLRDLRRRGRRVPVVILTAQDAVPDRAAPTTAWTLPRIGILRDVDAFRDGNRGDGCVVARRPMDAGSMYLACREVL